jgi:hypothetical protein
MHNANYMVCGCISNFCSPIPIRFQVHVFTYAVGPPAHSIEALRSIACDNRGKPITKHTSGNSKYCILLYSVYYCRFHITFQSAVPKFVVNLPITFPNSEVGRELRNEVRKFILKFELRL